MTEPDPNQTGNPGSPGNKAQTFNIPATTEQVELEKDTIRNLNKLALIMERMRLSEYLELIQNPRRLIFMNFVAGVARGFGFVMGMTVLVALALFGLSKMVDLPLIGKYIAKIVEIVHQELSNRPGRF